MKERLNKTIIKYATVLAIGLGYLLFMLWSGWGIPCIIYKLTGLQCPSCGVSRMFMALAHLDLAAAFGYNPFLFITMPVIIFCLIYSDVRYIKHGDREHKVINVILWAELALAVAYGIIRNV